MQKRFFRKINSIVLIGSLINKVFVSKNFTFGMMNSNFVNKNSIAQQSVPKQQRKDFDWSYNESDKILTINSDFAVNNSEKVKPWSGLANKIIEVKIGKNVTILGKEIFRSFSKLCSVEFENDSQLTEIGDGAFSFNLSLEEIKIPKKVKCIEPNAFKCCIKLKSATFEEGSELERIMHDAFHGCVSLHNIDVSENVQIDDTAFACYSGNFKLNRTKKIMTDKVVKKNSFPIVPVSVGFLGLLCLSFIFFKCRCSIEI